MRIMLRKTFSVLLLLALGTFAGAGQAETISSGSFSYRIDAPAAFIDRNGGAQVKSYPDAGDALFEVYDRQVSLLGGTPQEYVHFKSKPLTPSALQDLSQVYIMFNPAYQTLVVHAIRVWRDGRASDLTHSVKLDLMRREDGLDRNIYQGNVTAVGVLPDTRVGDVIDLEYTVAGANPIFGDRYADVFTMTQGNPVGYFRVSLVTPESRPLTVTAPAGVAVQETRGSGQIRYSVEKENMKPLPAEDRVPEWYQQRQLVQVSEYRDWAQVEAWAHGLFGLGGELSPEIRSQINEWKASGLPKEKLAVEALRWVQSRIRYFGIELGVNSHLPATPNVTVERKFGDCKDKSLLLTALLRELDIDAAPALASIAFRRGTENMMPSPAVFDHAIVSVRINGRQYWFDPTLQPQYGKLDRLGAIDYGGVLVLDGKATQLSNASYPAGYDNFYRKTSRFKWISPKEPVQMSLEVMASHNLAESIRNFQGNQSAEEFGKLFQGDILRVYPKARVVGNTEFLDDKENNQVTLRMQFSIDNFFKYEPSKLTALFVATEVLGWMPLPNVSQRTMPFSMPRYSRVMETVEFEYPEVTDITPAKSSNGKPGEFWNMNISSDLQRKKMVYSWSLAANKEAVPAAKTSEYTVETRGLREQLAMTFRMPVGKINQSDKEKIGRELQRYEKRYGNTGSGRVGAEVKDILNMGLASADIASGKLPDEYLAEAYKTRALAYDDRGDVPHALQDIRVARKLASSNVDYLTFEADTLLGDGQFAAASTLYQQALQQSPASERASADLYRSYAQAEYFLGHMDRAKEMLDEALRLDSGEGRVHTALWKYLVQGGDADHTVQDTLSAAQDRGWPYPIAEMLLGKISAEQLIEAASVSDKGLREDQLCEAYFFLGKKFQLEHDNAKAREYFQKSLDQGVTPFVENNFSLYELGKKKLPKQDVAWWPF